jgi:ureidoacrylate peracid hydrolase
VNLVPEKTAVVVVDMQNHFIARGGTWWNSGIDTSPMLALVPSIQRVLAAARGARARVVDLGSSLPPEPSETSIPPQAYRGAGIERWLHYCRNVGTLAPSRGTKNPAGKSPTWNADFVDGLTPLAGDLIVYKTRHSGFFQTDLDERLQSHGIESLIFTGCTTSICVESTLRDAFFRGYDCVLLEDCVAEAIGAQFDRTNHDATVLQTELVFGWVSDSAALAEAFAVEKAPPVSG